MGLVRISRLPLPPGSPAAMHAASLRARVAEALGPALARHLVDVRGTPDGLAVVLAGEHWEGARATIEEGLAKALGRPVQLHARQGVASTSPGPPPTLRVDSGDPALRLRRAAERLLARRAHVDGTGAGR